MLLGGKSRKKLGGTNKLAVWQMTLASYFLIMGL